MAQILVDGKTYDVCSYKCADAKCFDAYTDKRGTNTCFTRHYRGCPQAWVCPPPCSTGHVFADDVCKHCKATMPAKAVP